MFDSIVKYLEINIELVKLDIKEIIAKLIVDIIKLAVVGFLLSMGLVFLSIALGLWLGELTGSSITGTAIVGSLYVLAAIIFVAVRKKLRLLFEKAVAKYIPDNQKLINELNEHEKAEY
ncbi:phage holin family protein [Rhodoflexus sp.]